MADPNETIETGNLPTIITAAGVSPTAPVDLRATLTQQVSKTNPGYTNDLPGSLIEDIASTDVQALVMMDQARVEALNDLTPYGCNEFVLVLLGKVYGVMIGQPVNTSVFVTFSGLPGFVIGKGFTVSDGTHQYLIEDGGIIASDGQSSPLFAVATAAGSWAVPAGTVTTLITPPPTGFTLTVINSQPGIPSVAAESATQYRSRVLRAGLAASQGMSRYLRTLLSNVDGVQDRLIGIHQEEGGGWLIIVGGGDPYEVAYAIYTALFDISTLVGNTVHITAITNANPGVFTTDIDHDYGVGDPITIGSSNPPDYNGNFKVFAVPSPTSLSLGTAEPDNPLVSAVWTGGGGPHITFVTANPHAFNTGDIAPVSGCVPDAYNALWSGVTVIDPVTFTVPRSGNPGTITVLGQVNARIEELDTTLLPPYIDDAVIVTDSIEIVVSITDFPDTYRITYISPALQAVTGTVTWNTDSPNIVSPAAIAQLAGPALTNYINSIPVGKPINILQMEDAFADAIAAVLPPQYLTVLRFDMAVDGNGVLPVPGTKTYAGNPDAYFFSAGPADFTIVQG